MDMCVRVKRGLVVAGLLLGLGLFGLWTGVAMAAPADTGLTGSSIVVQGNRRVDADTVRSYFKVAPGEHLDPAKIDAGLKALYSTGLFQDVHISQSGGKLIVTVVESSVINKIVFEGNHRIKDEQMTEEIQSKERGALSKPNVQADTQRIIEIYQRNGRFDVKVVPKMIERPNNRVDLIFEIDEGEKTGIKQINFVGNRAYSDYRLKEVIKTSVSNWLSFLQTTDVYDTDRIEADRDLIRRFYLKHGYADVQVVSAVGEYDPAKKGFIVTFTIEEGALYHFSAIDIQSNVRAVDAASLRPVLRMGTGQIYNGESIEKTVEDMTIELARRGYPFGTVRPRGDRNATAHTVGVVFVVDEGTRAYIERINIRGNYRTRDYVIRREFDVNEGDPYNRALIDRAERRIKNLNFFKNVKITNEPGSAPDRIVINVDVEEQSTGDFSIMGGYSTSDGWLGQVSVQERNLLGTGRFAKAAVTYGQYTRGIELSFAEPYFLDTRSSTGLDLFAKQTIANSYLSYGTESYGGTIRWGLPIREDFAVQLRYSLYTQKITLPTYLNDCNNINPDFVNTFPTPAAIAAATAGQVLATPAAFVPPVWNGYNNALNTNAQSNCYALGQASLPVRVELANGATLTSAVGYGLTYNTLDNNKNPTNGVFASFGQDFAGVGGDVNYLRSTIDVRTYYEVVSDLVGVLHIQAGDMIGLSNDGAVRMLDDFKMGPNLVRGFQPAGIGPRDITPGTTNDNIGGTMYWGASLEFQYPFYFLPKDAGFRGAVFLDSGSVWGYKGETTNPATGEINGTINGSAGPFVCQCGMQFSDSPAVRMSAGASIIWESPFGPLRFDFAYPILKQGYDRTQWFAFGGGAHF
ncbi:MAG TPA: outer membrane protein assembly factor BamA [Xanthobacteraceae bacterium]|jgi:outer membrane protein insertion porin family|nr:outer membrane protein assembly factor BamA [Xanthobacteraceae bacterium]